MRKTAIRIGMFCGIIMLVGSTVPGAGQPAGPCGQIVTACQQAGFVQGGARTGDGIQVDCVRPIMQGSGQPRRASKPLPDIDPQLVAACKARNPNFGLGQRNGPPADTPPGPGPNQAPNAPPPAATDPTALAPPPALPAGAKRPNIIFVLADDFSLDLVQYMPHLLKMQQDGVTFANYFVTDSLCCPSRSSIFTGRYPHDTGIYRNVGPDGGYLGFLKRGHERTTFATALTAAGYHTAMLGKYLNGYQPRQHAVAPGWNLWDVAGNGYPGFNYDLNRNGKIVHYANRPEDYLTDVVSASATDFIKQQTPDTPFMIEIATFAPHAPYTPAPRDADAFPGLHAPRTPAFNAAPDAAAPKWLAALPALSEIESAIIDNDYRKRAQSVLAIDAMIGELQQAVAAIGAADNTYFVFSLRQRLSHGRAPHDAGEDDGVRHRHPRAAHRHRARRAGRTHDRGDRAEHRSVPDLRGARLRAGAAERRRAQPRAAVARRETRRLAHPRPGRASRPGAQHRRPGPAGAAQRQPARPTRRSARRPRSMSNTPAAKRNSTTSPPTRTSCATPSRRCPTTARRRCTRRSMRWQTATTPPAAGRPSGWNAPRCGIEALAS